MLAFTRNPFFGTAERAAALYESIQAASPRDRKTHIKKLIFGEGSNVDILEWPTPHLVPDIVRAATNLQIIGFDGLHGIDMDDFKSALVSLKDLRELRVCGEL